MNYLGNFATGQDIVIFFNTDGDPGITAGNIKIHKNGAEAGEISVDADEYIESFDGVDGINRITLDVSDHPTFYVRGCEYSVTETVALSETIATFSINNRPFVTRNTKVWYIDSALGNDDYDGHTKLTAKASFDGVKNGTDFGQGAVIHVAEGSLFLEVVDFSSTSSLSIIGADWRSCTLAANDPDYVLKLGAKSRISGMAVQNLYATPGIDVHALRCDVSTNLDIEGCYFESKGRAVQLTNPKWSRVKNSMFIGSEYGIYAQATSGNIGTIIFENCFAKTDGTWEVCNCAPIGIHNTIALIDGCTVEGFMGGASADNHAAVGIWVRGESYNARVTIVNTNIYTRSTGDDWQTGVWVTGELGKVNIIGGSLYMAGTLGDNCWPLDVRLGGSDDGYINTNGFQHDASLNRVSNNITVDNGVIAELLAATGVTAGGTWTVAKTIKVMAAVLAGKMQDKSGSTTIKEVLDADDGATKIAEITPARSSPYRRVTVS